jgi:hypothetical protein
MTFWYILWLFGIFLPVLVCCNKKNLASLQSPRRPERLFLINDSDARNVSNCGRKTVVGNFSKHSLFQLGKKCHATLIYFGLPLPTLAAISNMSLMSHWGKFWGLLDIVVKCVINDPLKRK